MNGGAISLEGLLSKSGELRASIAAHREHLTVYPGQRHVSSATAAAISLEHADAVLVLADVGTYASALALFRVQYEALVRGVWLLYAASDGWVEKLSAPLNTETARKGNEGPMLSKMLEELDGKTPPAVVQQLSEFKTYSWKALSSYVHVGLHPLTRTVEGYPAVLVEQMLRQSNGLALMATMLLTILSGDPKQEGKVAKLQAEFMSCCPNTADKCG